jgi:hypothetical protein
MINTAILTEYLRLLQKSSKVTLKITNDPAYKFDDITVADSDSILCPFLESKLKLKKVVLKLLKMCQPS